MQLGRAEPKESRDRTADTAVNGARFGVPMCKIKAAKAVIESLSGAEVRFGARRSPNTVIYPEQERMTPCAY